MHIDKDLSKIAFVRVETVLGTAGLVAYVTRRIMYLIFISIIADRGVHTKLLHDGRARFFRSKSFYGKSSNAKHLPVRTGSSSYSGVIVFARCGTRRIAAVGNTRTL